MKKVIMIVLILVLIAIYALPVQADDSESVQGDEYSKVVGELSDDIENATGDEVNEILKENEISLENTDGISKLSAWNVITSVAESFLSILKKPAVVLGKIIAVTLLCVLAKSMAPDGSAVTGSFNIIGVLATVGVMYDTLNQAIEIIRSSLSGLSDFMTAYIPIFASVAAAGGSVTASGSYYATTLMLCEIIGYASNYVVMPFLSIVLAISLVSAINPRLQFCGVAESVKKASQWILGGMMTIFAGLLTIQGFSGTATDSLASRAVKFAASSFIPVVGGAVSEAYSTIHGSIGVIRTGVGTIGIIIIFVMIIRPVLTIIAIKFIITLAQMICGVFDQKECAELLKSTNAVMSIGLSMVVCVSIVFVIATAVLMLTAMNMGA